MAYGPDQVGENPVSSNSVNTEYATAAIVIGCVVALIMIARGFRGINVGGVSVGVQ